MILVNLYYKKDFFTLTKNYYKMKILKKAYKVWVHSQIGEYPVFTKNDIKPVYADNAYKAKCQCDFTHETNEDGDDASYIDINCIRDKDYDKVEHNGEEMFRWQYLKQLIKEKRKNSILKLKDSDTFYIQGSSQYVGNSILWHGLNGNEYTTDISNAQKYTKEQIIKKFENLRDSDIIWSAKHVDSNVSMHVDAQNLDEKYKK